MKTKWLVSIIAAAVVAVGGITVATVSLLGGGLKVVLDGKLTSDSVIEYTGEKIQLPVAHIEDRAGNIVSYNVSYRVTSLDTGDKMEDPYATFDLKVGKYEVDYIYNEKKSVKENIPFEVADTTAPEITFSDIPNGLFLQDISLEDSQKLPSYVIADASELDGMEVTRTLSFKGESDDDYQECEFREINNSYDVTNFGKFKYSVTATDAYGNKSTNEAEWKIKDRDWKPAEMPPAGYLADYSSEGYTNLIEGGDANQYYKIGSDYADEWLEEYEGANGVLKVDMGFNNAAGYGNNTIKLRFARNFTKKDIAGKYLAVRMYLDAEHLANQLLFAGVNVAIREDGINRAFTTGITDIETGKWVTYYIDADLAEHIGMYPNARYNPTTTFYEGGDAATALQLCFQRKSGYNDRMVLYVDSITLAEKLPDTAITISGKTAKWDAVKGASGYKVNLNGEESVVEGNSIKLDGAKGYIRVTPLGDGALTLDGEEVSAVYGLDAGNKLAAFDDELYIHLFSDKLKFSTSNEHIGYKPSSMTGTKTSAGVTMELGASSWGVCNGVRLQFPEAKAKGSNTAVRITMEVSDAKYRAMRVYDYDGQLLQSIDLDSSNTGKYVNFDVDLATYNNKLAGLQFIFGPSAGMVNVPEGVTLKFKSIEFVNNYYEITVDGQKVSCAGKRNLTAGYTQKNLVQFTSVYNFGVPADDTPLSFSGTLLLDGKKIEKVSVVGYPNTDTICFKVPHDGKVLTIMKDSVLYYNGKAIEIGETFNAKWDGTKWVAVSKIPSAPEKEYVTIEEKKYEVVDKVSLNPGFTTGDLVQFMDFYDLGAPAEDTPFGFEGTVLLDGKETNASVVGYKDNTTITLRVPHNGKVLTVMKDSYVYYGEQAVKVKETFNAKWDGTKWVAVKDIPTPPEKEYVTVGGEQKEVMDKVILTAGYTADSLVQFTNVYDFGLSEQGALGFSGTVLLDGVEQTAVDFQGYPSNTTICLQSIAHKNKVVTIMKDSIIYLGDKAVVVKETFNSKWDGTSWTPVAEIPTPPEKEYVTIGGEQKELVDTITLSEGYATGALVQFTNVYDFGVPADNTPLTFSGEILVDGVPADVFDVIGYANNKTICFNIMHGDKVLTIKEGSYIYYGDKAVKVGATFNKKYSILANNWTPIAEIPTAEKKLTLKGVHYGNSTNIMIDTNLSDSANCANFLATDNGNNIVQSGAQVAGWFNMGNFAAVPEKKIVTVVFNNPYSNNESYTLGAGSKFVLGDGTYTLDATYVFTYNGSSWGMSKQDPTKEYVTVGGEQKEVVKKTALTPGYTADSLVQFTEVYDFGLSAQGPLEFSGKVLLDGVEQSTVDFQGYPSNTTICLQGIAHKNKVLTIMKDSVIYHGDKAVVVAENFNAKWDGTSWAPIAEIPTAEKKLTLKGVHYGLAGQILIDTNLPETANCANFLASDNGNDIKQSGAQQAGYFAMNNFAAVTDKKIVTVVFNANFTSGQSYKLAKGSKFVFGDGTYTLDKDYTFTWNGSAWDMLAEEPKTLTLKGVHYGDGTNIMIDTNLSDSANCANFLATDNGNNIIQSGAQAAGYFAMNSFAAVTDKKIVTVVFNANFTSGQTYQLGKDSRFVFGDGSYLLDKDYTFTFDGSNWSMQ